MGRGTKEGLYLRHGPSLIWRNKQEAHETAKEQYKAVCSYVSK